jgi:hypothetical protein
MVEQEFDESGRIIISYELRKAIKEKIAEQELYSSGMGSFACAECRITSMRISQKNDTVTYICKDYEDGENRDEETDYADLEGEVRLSTILRKINLKEFCPSHNCPHYVRDSKTFDPKLDSCDCCLVFDGY